jgi:hypothetical protein
MTDGLAGRYSAGACTMLLNAQAAAVLAMSG